MKTQDEKAGPSPERTTGGTGGSGHPVKMSELLKDVARPLLDTCTLPGDEDAFRFSLKLAAAVWNAHAVLAPEKRAEALRVVMDETRKVIPPHVHLPFDEIVARAERYAGETRTIQHVELRVGPNGEAHITVGSSD